MDYKNAICVLPDKLIMEVQEYIDGEYLYIPRKTENRKRWGELKSTRNSLHTRNKAIFEGYSNDISVKQLAAQYYLSPKTVYKILSKM